MQTWKGCFPLLALVLLAIPLTLGDNCVPTPPAAGTVLVNQAFAVGGGGGYADVPFDGTAGQKIRITLTGSPNNMEPYAEMQLPSGASNSAVQNGLAVNGVNIATVTLSETGQFTLTVFDGANLGGSVAVRIEVVP